MARSNKKSRASLPSKKNKRSEKTPANAKQLTKQEMLNRVVRFFEQNPSQSVNYKQVASK